MADKDLNNDQMVTDQDLNKAGSVDRQGLTDQAASDQDVLADGTNKDKTVKYSEFEKANKRAKTAEEDLMTAQRQLELATMQRMQPVQPQQQPKSSYEQAMADLGVTADDCYGETHVKVMNRKEQLDRVQTQQQNAVLSNQQFMSAHTDVSQVVGSVNPATGQIMVMSPELGAILARKPYLAGACNVSLQATYNIVIQERRLAELEQNDAVSRQHQARQEVENATLPLGGSAAGGGGGDVVDNQKLLTQEEVDEIDRKRAAGEYS